MKKEKSPLNVFRLHVLARFCMTMRLLNFGVNGGPGISLIDSKDSALNNGGTRSFDAQFPNYCRATYSRGPALRRVDEDDALAFSRAFLHPSDQF